MKTVMRCCFLSSTDCSQDTHTQADGRQAKRHRNYHKRVVFFMCLKYSSHGLGLLVPSWKYKSKLRRTERQTERDRDRDRDRETERQRDRDRDRERFGGAERERERGKEG
jgi:hypothetical protein